MQRRDVGTYELCYGSISAKQMKLVCSASYVMLNLHINHWFDD